MSARRHATRPVLVRLTEADLEPVATLEDAHGWPTGGSRGRLAATLADPATAVFGLMVGETLAGHAVVARLPFEAELQAILVDESRRRQGLARRLLEVVADQAREWGSERLLLEVRAGNGAAIALYRRAGFSDDGRRRDYYPPREAGEAREDAVLMSLPLDRA
ncbi:GNAT family N-acetyltransferase [Halomonas sp. C05BenzN]|uniref:GNAT family N-acetyltransferase n=1 Tax=Halomonas sp. C05BenzN TaxID=3411041 RepID=UPI003B9325E2